MSSYVVSGFSRTTLRTTLALLALLALACSAPRPEPGSQLVVRPSLQPITLPDLANAEPSVAERIRAQHSSVTALGDAPGVSDEERGRAYGELGKLLIAANLLTDAEPALLNARALAGREMRWHYYLGHLHRLQHAPDKAAASFEEARALRPDDVPTLVWLGRLYIDQGRLDTAAPLLEKALALQPRSAAALFELGRLALARREFAQAAGRLEAALREDAGAVQAHYPLAMAYRGLGREDEAAAHLEQWKDVELRPADPLMEEVGSLLGSAIEYEVRGTRALDRRDWAEAIASFRAGLERAPSDPSLHLNLGTALFLSGDVEQARSAFETAIRLSPGYARGHFALGLLEAERGRPDAAIERFSAAVKYDPAFIDARFSLAEMLRGTGRTALHTSREADKHACTRKNWRRGSVSGAPASNGICAGIDHRRRARYVGRGPARRHRRGREPGAARKGPDRRDRWQRPVPHRGAPAGPLHRHLHADRLQRRQA